MSRTMARTRDFNCLKHITWTINREYQALWKLPIPEVKRMSSLEKYPSITDAAVPQVLTARSPSSVRRYAKGAYNQEQNDGAEDVVGAGQATKAGRSDAVGEEMRVETFVRNEVGETDGDGLIEKAKKGVKKVGEKMKDASDYMRTGADKAEEKEGNKSTTQQVMDKGADVVDGAADTVKDAASNKH